MTLPHDLKCFATCLQCSSSSLTHDVIIPVFTEAQYVFNFQCFTQINNFGDEEIMNRLTEETIKQTVRKMMTAIVELFTSRKFERQSQALSPSIRQY